MDNIFTDKQSVVIKIEKRDTTRSAFTLTCESQVMHIKPLTYQQSHKNAHVLIDDEDFVF